MDGVTRSRSPRQENVAPARRLIVTICQRECGVVSLPIERGGRTESMDAVALSGHLEALVARRGLGHRVRIQNACAGGCAAAGPNVSVRILAMPAPGEAPDDVAVGWRTYIASLDTLDCLAQVLDDNLGDPPRRRAARSV